ncbi:DNA cytosine methyltransferase [Flammeovirga kamogawensis]|uniref:DNA cytosine methyltransferase n=1 Tax=Flammeovirga kamogawensis TaxID=373891 RepID=UPI00185618C9|nr:DNA cytosine methyltransferase [Flammeovirga kamogawensis]MBB6461373.1 putative RNA methylase [Flammeovirga kamogawensis]
MNIPQQSINIVVSLRSSCSIFMNIKGLKFIDLFASIGGFHQALTSFGAECVFASEWDKYASDTYEA